MLHKWDKCDTMKKSFPSLLGRGKGAGAMKELETILKNHP